MSDRMFSNTQYDTENHGRLVCQIECLVPPQYDTENHGRLVCQIECLVTPSMTLRIMAG